MRLHRLLFVTTFAAVLFVGRAAPAEAQECMTGATCNHVGPDGKGLMGGLIVGAEIGFMVNALIVNAGVRELDEWWAWILWPAALGAGGAVAGYFALEDPMYGMTRGSPEGAVALFAISMALIVPTFVGVLALTAYSPGADPGGGGATGEEDAGDPEPVEESSAEQLEPQEPAEEAPAADEPPAEPQQGAPSEGGPESRLRDARSRVLAGGPGILRFDDGRLLLGLPMIYATDMFTENERAHAHLPQLADVRVPVVSGAF